MKSEIVVAKVIGGEEWYAAVKLEAVSPYVKTEAGAQRWATDLLNEVAARTERT